MPLNYSVYIIIIVKRWRLTEALVEDLYALQALNYCTKSIDVGHRAGVKVR